MGLRKVKNNKRINKRIVRAAIKAIPFGLGPGTQILDLMEELRRSRNSIDQKIDQVTESLRETSTVIKELEEELEERTETLKSLKEEYERYSKMNEIEGEQAAAFVKQLELSINKGKATDRWVSFIISIGAGFLIFVLGLVLSPILSGWIGISQ